MDNKPEVGGMNIRDTELNQKYVLKREIPLWGIITIALSLFGGSYSMYASYMEMAKSVDRLSTTVEKLRDSQIQFTIKDNQHDSELTNHSLQIQDIRRDVEDLKKSQRWIPK
ncbi:MAG: hypothetical protein V4493_01215 [Pseudomonadota bacterium]